MTLIIGLNLSNRIYLAADTRLTFSDGSFVDDIIKIFPLCGKEVPIVGEAHRDSNTILVAVAGSLSFAQYLSKKIEGGLRVEELSDDIRIFNQQILDFLRPHIDEWFKNHEFSESKCCMIFAGTSTKNKKEINLDKLKELEGLIFKNADEQKEESDRVMKNLENDSIFQALSKKIPKENILDPFINPKKLSLAPWLADALKLGRDKLYCDDHLLFSLSITPNTYELLNAEWGEFLAHGGGATTDNIKKSLTKNDLPDDILAQMELKMDMNTQPHMLESTILSTSIESIIKDYDISGVGGAKIVTFICEGSSGFITSQHRELSGEAIEQIYSLNGKPFYRKGSESPIELKPFISYKLDQPSSATL